MTQSLWMDTVPVHADHRFGPLTADRTCDVAIVGGGYTGLWCALTIRTLDPTVRVAVFEAEHIGFGASGRNGGWASALYPRLLHEIAAEDGADAARSIHRALVDGLDDFEKALGQASIDADFAHGGTLTLAHGRAQETRLRSDLAADHSVLGITDDDLCWLDADDTAARLQSTGATGALFTPHCARIHPAKLVLGLAEAAARAGVEIFESSRVTHIARGTLTANGHTVRAPSILTTTEGYRPTAATSPRQRIPIYSLMIATEPLADDTWAQIGLNGRETFTDGRRMIVYGQRTADGRLAFGGRGAPYHFGSSTRPDFELVPKVFGALHDELTTRFPVLRSTAITHRWGGPLGIHRDQEPRVAYDPWSGLGSSGGYAGDGVTMSFLCGRMLARRVMGQHVDDGLSQRVLDRLPRRWEPEPARWAAINTVSALSRLADRAEQRTGRPATVIDRTIARITSIGGPPKECETQPGSPSAQQEEGTP